MDEQPTKQKEVVNLGALAQLWDRGMNLNGIAPSRPTRPYAQSSWVYICVNTIITACRSIQMMMSDSSDRVIESGEAYDLLLNNPELAFTKFLTDTVGYFTLYRQAYWVFLDKDITRPKSLFVAGPDQLKPVVRRGVLVGYKLRIPGSGTTVPLFIEDVYPLLDFNPYDPYTGIGPTTAGKLAISSGYQASLFNEATLANGGVVGNLITIPGSLTKEQKELLVGQFESRHMGARNAGRTCIMSGGADVKKLSQSMADLQMLDLRSFDAKEICSIFGVPVEVAGLNSEAQYAHGPAQQRLILNTVAPTLSFIAEHITTGILDKFKHRQQAGVDFTRSKSFCGTRLALKSRPSYRQAKLKAAQSNNKIFAWFNIEDHPTVQEMLRERAEKVLKYTERGVPLNDCIDAYDLPFTKNPWGDHYWIGMGQVPATWILEAGPEDITGPSLSEGEGDEGEGGGGEGGGGEGGGGEDKKTALEQNLNIDKQKDRRPREVRIWKNWVVSWAGIERKYKESMRQFFLRQQRVLTKKLKTALGDHENIITKANVDNIIASVVFDLKTENGKLKVINHTFFREASELGIRQAFSENASLSADELEAAVQQAKLRPAVKRSITISSRRITKVNKTTQDRVARQLRTGLEKGEDLNQLTARIKETLGSNRARALGVARTQTAGAVNTGRQVGMKDAGVKRKGWITSGDDHVRDSHTAAGIKYSEGIPIDQAFVVGGESLMHPGDPSGSAAEIANCRCLQIAMAAGKSIDLAAFGKFYSYSDMLAAHRKGADNGS